MKPQPEHDPQPDQHALLDLTDTIGSHVIKGLGQPGQPYKVQVRRLWGNRYRVNVLVGSDVTAAKVVNSYFVVADLTGGIVTSTPAITRQY